MKSEQSLLNPNHRDDIFRIRAERRRSIIVTAVVVAVVILIPFVLEHRFYRNVISLICLWGAMAGAWNILGGYAGKFSLGNAAFFGTGAYTSTIMFVKGGVSPWIGMLVGMGISVALALFLGIITLRLKGKFFALCTIAFIALMEIGAVHLRGFTGGSEGMLIPWKPGIKNMIFESDLVWVYVLMGYMFFVYFLSRWLEVRPLGYRWVALRENEDAAEALGINTFAAKLSSFALSAALTSIGGSLYAQYSMFIEPIYVFGLELSTQFALYTIIGGMGTALGPIMGAALITPLEIFLRSSFPELASGVSMAMYALLLIIVVLFIPNGLVMEAGSRLKKLFARSLGSAPAPSGQASGGGCKC